MIDLPAHRWLLTSRVRSVDDLSSIDAIEEYVDSTHALVVFLSGSVDGYGRQRSDYFASRNSVRELRRAVAKRINIVFILEMDATHGGVPLSTHLESLRALPDVCPDVTEGELAELRALLEAAVPIPWFRVRQFQDESLRLLLQAVLRSEGAARADGRVYVPDPLMRTPPRLAAPAAGRGAHLYVSPHNAGAKAVAELLAQEARECCPTSVPLVITSERADAAEHFLLYLNSETHSSAGAEALHSELWETLACGVHILLAHEQRSSLGGLPFADVLDATPRPLLDGRIYKEIATPLYEGSHLRVSLRLLLQQVARAGGGSAQLFALHVQQRNAMPASRRGRSAKMSRLRRIGLHLASGRWDAVRRNLLGTGGAIEADGVSLEGQRTAGTT